jgi:hypothetical protein
MYFKRGKEISMKFETTSKTNEYLIHHTCKIRNETEKWRDLEIKKGFSLNFRNIKISKLVCGNNSLILRK